MFHLGDIIDPQTPSHLFGGHMSKDTKTNCKDPAGHWKHLCELRKQGKEQEVKDLMVDPGHRCLNCNAVANQAQNLCNPSSFSKV